MKFLKDRTARISIAIETVTMMTMIINRVHPRHQQKVDIGNVDVHNTVEHQPHRQQPLLLSHIHR